MIIRIDPGGSRIVKFHPDRISIPLGSAHFFPRRHGWKIWGFFAL